MSRARRLWIVLVLDVALVIALVLVGLRAHSLAVLAEGADYIADAAAAGLSLLALHLTMRAPTPRHPQGFPKATAFAALANATWLLVISVAVVIGAVARLATGEVEVSGRPVVIVSAIAAVVMGFAVVVLRAELEDDDDEPAASRDGTALAMRAVLLDTVADVASAAGVAVVGLVITVTGGWFWLDPAVALLIALVVGWHAVVLVRTVAVSLRSPVALTPPE
ncbi:MAG: cation transporter [Frankiales bacterium]|nr:cation transporter [Frankiales bacterium]